MSQRLFSRLIRHIPRGQLVRYLVVGVWNTAFGYATFAGFTALLTGVVPAPYLAASLLASLINITVSFLGYKWFVFKTKGHYLREWLRCLAVYGGSIALGLVLLPPAVWAVSAVTGNPGSAPYIAGALLMGGQVILSFIGHKNFSFKAAGTSPASPREP